MLAEAILEKPTIESGLPILRAQFDQSFHQAASLLIELKPIVLPIVKIIEFRQGTASYFQLLDQLIQQPLLPGNSQHFIVNRKMVQPALVGLVEQAFQPALHFNNLFAEIQDRQGGFRAEALDLFLHGLAQPGMPALQRLAETRQVILYLW